MLESYTKSAYLVDKHIKSFVRPECVIDVLSPHGFQTTNMDLSVNINYEKYNKLSPHYLDYDVFLMGGMENMNAYIAHHVFQSFETFFKRKCLRKRDDNNLNWNHNYNDETLHCMYNQIDNFLPRDKYNEKNKQKMILYSS